MNFGPRVSVNVETMLAFQDGVPSYRTLVIQYSDSSHFFLCLTFLSIRYRMKVDLKAERCMPRASKTLETWHGGWVWGPVLLVSHVPM